MKKVITILVLLIVCNASAQIEIDKEYDWDLVGKFLGMEHHKQGDLHRFTYIDVTDRTTANYQSFSFVDVNNAVDDFYKAIYNGIKNKVNDEIKVDIPDAELTMKFVTAVGICQLQIHHSKDGEIIGLTPWISKRTAKKLFAK